MNKKNKLSKPILNMLGYKVRHDKKDKYDIYAGKKIIHTETSLSKSADYIKNIYNK